MKRRYSTCEASLPSPEYSEPEYLIINTKKTKITTKSHDFIEVVEDSMLDFINSDGSITQRKYKSEDSKHLILIFFGVINDFLDPIA